MSRTGFNSPTCVSKPTFTLFPKINIAPIPSISITQSHSGPVSQPLARLSSGVSLEAALERLDEQWLSDQTAIRDMASVGFLIAFASGGYQTNANETCG